MTDQRPVDAFSLTYDSQPLADEVAILGLPHVSLRVSAEAPLAAEKVLDGSLEIGERNRFDAFRPVDRLRRGCWCC